MEVQLAVAKVAKYAVAESGDTVEVTERPHGGISVVLADGQRSGRSAKLISNLVARKAISLLAEGVRDGAAARAAHDYLRTHRSGKVSAELVILSIDLETGTLVISRNTQAPVLVHRPAFESSAESVSAWRSLDAPATNVGVYARTRPQIEEIPLLPGLIVVAFSDGVWRAGERRGQAMNLLELLQAFPTTISASEFADDLLAHALRCEQGRPGDDLTVVVVRVSGMAGDEVRRMHMSLPVPPRVHGAWNRP